jgi:hypothetical protein
LQDTISTLTGLKRALRAGADVYDVGVAGAVRPHWTEVTKAKLRSGDQLILFVLAGAGLVLLSPKFLVQLSALYVRLISGTPVRYDVTALPNVPPWLPVGVTVALLTFRLQRTARVAALVTTFGALALALISPSAMLPLGLWAVIAFVIIRLPLPRIWSAVLVTAFMTAAFTVATRLWEGMPIVRLLGGFPILVPLMWYSVYEHRQSAALSFRRFALYIGGRLVGTPAVTYRDVFSVATGAELTATRWAGIRTLYIALVAASAAVVLQKILDWSTMESAGGVPLLLLSYAQYVILCCSIVVKFNTFIGVLRLFGIPVRSNFRYWLLARTPNEHWQRWNVLAREWFLTFVFYPTMRGTRSLFAAVMAALLCAGALHMIPPILLRGFDAPEMTGRFTYWFMNGVAIYAFIKIPRSYPGLIDRLGISGSRAWSVIGILLTSTFYAVLHGLRTTSTSWTAMGDYLARLVGA